jgi:hypothetical protein
MKKNNIEKSFTTKLLQSFLIAVTMVPVYADDTEIFYTESEVNNNILFVMDNSGSMTAEVEGTAVNNGEDYVVTSTVNHVRDDTEEGAVYWGADLWPYYRKLLAENPGTHWRISYNKAKAWYYSVKQTNPYSADLELGQEYDAEVDKDIKKRVGLRFTGLQIPKRAEITSAYIQFKASNIDPVDHGAANLRIRIRNANNTSFFSTSRGSIRNGSWYGGVNWNPPVWATPNESGDAQKTNDLTNLVQHVVNRSGWRKGRAMSFYIEGDGKRVAQSFDSAGEEGAPVLVVTYAPEEGLKTRLQVMQDALKIVLKDAPDNLSVGIMHYGDSTGSRKNYPNGVSFPVTQLNALVKPILEKSVEINGVPNWRYSTLPVPSDTVTVRGYLSEIADSWKARGNTPIVESIYEASLYFRGKRSKFGDYQANYSYAARPSTYTRPAPNLVEALTNHYDVSVCTGRYRGYKVWNSEIERWRAGNAWKTCPENPLVPTGPGSKENCALDVNEYNCGAGEPYHDCVDWVNAVYKRVCTGTDESGNQTGCRWVLKSNGYCKNNIYEDEERRDRWCSYKTCRNEYVRKHVPEYNTPTISDCQSNNIILMSDGKPETRNSNGTERYPAAISEVKAYMGNPGCEDAPFGFKSGQCGSELTHHLAENDINPGLNGDQTIDTYVIGFSSGITEDAEGYLKSLVTVEDDPETSVKEGYFSAQNEEELAAAFTQTLKEIAEEARSQASPGYSVNVKSGLEHEDDIYIPVFDKSTGSRWSGNLKKFKLVDDGGHRFIRGKVTKAGNTNAVGYINAMTELGLFKDDAWDDWSKSEIPDGNNVEKGGTASLLTNPRKRNLYTNIVPSELLSSPLNSLKAKNNNIKNKMLFDKVDLGLNEEAANKYRKKLLKFIGGWVDGEDSGFSDEEISSHARKHMGDMLHSEPVVITYEHGSDNGDGKKQYIFAATNEGYLHVFDSTTGKEKFAFMPKELLKNIHSQFTQKGNHVYGIDGNLSFFIKNDNHNGQIDGNEEVWIYFGLRRGGTSYYALDVTNINKPKLKWVVKGGDSGFEHLNQSWSAPYIANSKVDGNKKPVIIFTGGNDPEKMDYGSGKDYSPADVTGSNTTNTANGVYIVDADSGEKLWDIMDVDGSDNLTHGIPGGARILDTNRNDYLDRLYFADAGGNVWRLDLDESLQSSKSVLNKFASLGGSGVAARKFYNEPDVAMLSASGKAIFSVSVGSGVRPHPMNELIDDHMFILLDKAPFVPMKEIFDGTIEIGDLEKVTIKGAGSSKEVGKIADFEGKKITQLSGKKGWYASFGESGEKVLASSITFEGSIIFTTLVPKVLNQGDLISACAAPSTQGRLYAMDLLTGEASMDLDNSEGDPNDNDVFTTVSASEIPGTPQRVFNKLECSGGSCTHNVDIRIGKKSSQAGTTDVEAVESVYWNAPENNH